MTTRLHNTEAFAARLKILMKQANVNQQELADKIGCSRKTINQYCTGKAIPDDQMKRELEKFFGVRIDYILGIVKYPKSSDEVGDACTKADTELGSEGLKNLEFEIELYRRFYKEFGVQWSDLTPRQQKKLEREVKDFIRYKLSTMEGVKNNGKGK